LVLGDAKLPSTADRSNRSLSGVARDRTTGLSSAVREEEDLKAMSTTSKTEVLVAINRRSTEIWTGE
tara:strand:- start:218 stop:418 length:201 start_codon:yes stop_codon:yes gene_type:complete